MVADEKTPKVTKRLTKAGWGRDRTVGSHSMWKCRTGRHQVPVPDGHRTISPGVVGKINKAIESCDCKEEQ